MLYTQKAGGLSALMTEAQANEDRRVRHTVISRAEHEWLCARGMALETYRADYGWHDYMATDIGVRILALEFDD